VTLTAFLAMVVIAGLLLGLLGITIAMVFWPLPDTLDRMMLGSLHTIIVIIVLSILIVWACGVYDYNPQLWPAHNSPERTSARWQKESDARVEKMRQELRKRHGDDLFEEVFGNGRR